MSLAEIERAKRESIQVRLRFEATLAAAQERLRPKSLAGEAWDGVKEKSNELADGALEAVKRRPIAVSAALGALALFLAREPLKRAASRLISGDGINSEEEELVETADAADAEGVS